MPPWSTAGLVLFGSSVCVGPPWSPSADRSASARVWSPVPPVPQLVSLTMLLPFEVGAPPAHWAVPEFAVMIEPTIGHGDPVGVPCGSGRAHPRRP